MGRTVLTASRYYCPTCKKEYENRNAFGLAALHSKKHHHEVEVVLCYHIVPEGA